MTEKMLAPLYLFGGVLNLAVGFLPPIGMLSAINFTVAVGCFYVSWRLFHAS